MSTEVKLPRLGQGMESGVVVRWLKKEGDHVAKGDPLYELDTEKVTQEIEAEADGVLAKIVVPEGEVEVGATLALIETDGAGDGAAPAAESRAAEPEPAAADASAAAPAAPEPTRTSPGEPAPPAEP